MTDSADALHDPKEPAHPGEHLLEVRGVCKRYGRTVALQNLTVSVRDGEILCLLGPSGCGKTTLLRLIAGLEPPDCGAILFAGRNLAGVPVHQRKFGFMFQDFALFPHKNVAQNVAFGLRMAGLARAEIEQRVNQVLALVDLDGKQNRSVDSLSGGEQQRVALARSLAPSPRLLLLDEPLGSLDRALRERLLNELRSILREVGVTSITVTHDQQEAFALADRVLVMDSGRALQIGTPDHVYRRPASASVARFLGLTNLLQGRWVKKTPPQVQTAIGTVEVDRADDELLGQKLVTVLFHPEAATVCPGPTTFPLTGTITACSFRGGHYQIELEHVAGPRLTFALRAAPGEIPVLGESMQVHVDTGAISLVADELSLAGQVTVTKLNVEGEPVLSYLGQVLFRTPTSITLAAPYGSSSARMGGTTMEPGDRLVEHHFSNRWYNIMEVYDGRDGPLKGWYCNITRPAVISEEDLAAEDLALDLFVSPQGDATVMDEEEFWAAPLTPDDRAAALNALRFLQDLGCSDNLPRTGHEFRLD